MFLEIIYSQIRYKKSWHPCSDLQGFFSFALRAPIHDGATHSSLVYNERSPLQRTKALHALTKFSSIRVAYMFLIEYAV